ncbi:MAG: glucose 1-dehydrogenase [Chitinophagaceae bacterium]
MENQFKGQVAIVTGAGSGIGEACALLYAQLGAKVVVSDINEKHGLAVVDAIKKNKGEAIFVKADVTKPQEAQHLVDETINAFGKLDIAVNNAGIGGESNPVGELSIEGWDKVISVNLSSVFYCMRYQIPAMLKNGKGAIVNMASILGKVGFANSAGYVAAKHGVVGLTENAAIEYSAKNIRVNAVGPGFIETPLLSAMDANAKNALVSLHPIGRLGKASEVAELVIWLSSDKASFVSGGYYAVDGAYLAR